MPYDDLPEWKKEALCSRIMNIETIILPDMYKNISQIKTVLFDLGCNYEKIYQLRNMIDEIGEELSIKRNDIEQTIVSKNEESDVSKTQSCPTYSNNIIVGDNNSNNNQINKGE